MGLGLVPPTDPKLRARRQSRERHARATGSVEPSGTPGDPPEPRHHQWRLERFRKFRRTASSPFLNLIRLDRKENRFSRRLIAAKDPTRLASGKIRPARPGRRSPVGRSRSDILWERVQSQDRREPTTLSCVAGPYCKLPPALKCGGFPAHPAPLARGLSMPRCPVQANRAHARPTYLRPVFRLATELRVFNRLLRSPRLVSRGSSPGVPEPWYWLTFYAGSLPLPATAYVRRPDCTADRARRLSAFRFSTSLGGRAEAPGRRSSTATESGVDSTG